MTNTRHRSIWVVLLAFLALCLLYNALTPLGEGPDEPGHAGYVFFLAREARLPLQCAPPCVGDVPGSGHHPPLAYLLALPAALWLPHDLRAIDLPGNPRFTWAGGDQVNAAAHGTREQWPWDRQVWAWRMARLASTLAGIATVAFTYLTAEALRRQAGDQQRAAADGVPILAAALVAFNPQFVFTASLITNDALLAALGAALLWLIAGGQPTPRRATALGLTLGLALITKQSALLFVPLALAWCCIAGGWRAPQGQPWPARLLNALLVCGGAAAIGGWWYLRNVQVYGDLFGLQLFQSEFITQAFDATHPAAWAGALQTLHSSFWARFGWMNLPAPPWTYWVYGCLILFAVAGWMRSIGQTNSAPHWSLPALPLLALAWLLSFALTAGLVAWQGRLLFPALAALAVLLAHGLTRWQAARVTRVLPLGLFALAVWMPLGVIQPAYPFRTTTERAALAEPGVPTYARFARETELGAVIRTWRIDGPLRPGSTVTLTLVWNALSRQDRNWHTFIHLVDEQRQIVAEDNREPGDSAYPMTQWIAGDWMISRYPLVIPADLPSGRYTLAVGLWDPRTYRRAAYFNDDNVRDPEGDHVRLSTIMITR